MAVDFFRKYYRPSILNIEILNGASPNVCFLILSDNEKFVLRKCKDKDSNWISNQEFVLQGMFDQGFPIQPLLCFENGKKTILVDGDAWQIRSYMEGRNYRLGSESDAMQAATTLGKLHCLNIHSEFNQVPIKGADYWIIEPDDKFKKLEIELEKLMDKKTVTKMMKSYSKLLNDSLQSLSESIYYSLFQSLTHGDFHGNNLLYQNKNLVSVIDMDTLGFRPRVYDFGIAFYLLLRNRHGSFELNNKISQKFIKIYSSTNPMDKKELEVMIPLLQLHFLPTADYLQMVSKKGDKLLKWYISWSNDAANSVKKQISMALL